MTATNWSGTNGSAPPANTLGTTLGSSAVVSSNTTVTSLNRVNPATTNLSTVNWTLTFAAANTGVSASNFSLSGAAATGASVGTPTTSNGGLTWNVPVTTGSTDGTLTLSLANATGTTPGVSTTLPFAGQSYTMDKTLPTVSIGAPSVSTIAAGAGPVTYLVTFTDPNFNTSTLDGGDITLNTTGTATAGVKDVTGAGNTRTVSLSSITGAGTIGITVAAARATDTAGNANLVSAASTTFTVLSNNADLSALALTTATINEAFAANTTAYTSSVPNATSSVTVTPTRAQANATIEARVAANAFVSVTSGSPSASLPLAVGPNTIQVKVTAQDGTTIKTYSIAVTRAAGVPGAPTVGTATAGTNANATVTFTAPASDGGSPITSYSVTSAPGGVVNTGATSPITISGLNPGIVYTFRVQAFNAIGPSALSAASNSITAVSAPGAPTSPVATAGNGNASVAFTAPAVTGGSAITSYTVTW